MPTAWTAFSAGQVLSAPGPGPVIYELHVSAFERLRAAFGDGWASVSGRTPFPRPTAGQPFLQRTMWGDPSGPTTAGGVVPIDNALFYPGVAGFNLGGFNPFDSSALGRFIDHRAAIEGAAAPPLFWTMPTIRAAAGLPLTKFYYGTGAAAPTEITSARGTLMKRVRYRAINTVNDTTDDQGNAAAAGQRAFSAGGGQRYRYVAAGNWTRDESAQADLIDNTQDPPNTVCEFVGPGTPIPGPSLWGAPRLADLALLHLFEERRALMDLMRWTLLPVSPGVDPSVPFIGAATWDDTGLVNTSGTTYPSDAAAEAALATAYAANVPSAGNGYPATLPEAWNNLLRRRFTSSEDYAASAARADADFVPIYGDTGTGVYFAFSISGMAKKWSYFAKGGEPDQAEVSHDAFVFDNQGDPVNNGTYHAWSNSAGPDPATAPHSGVLGAIGTFPGNYNTPPMPAAPGDELATLTGYAVTDLFLLCKWNVDGGLTYCSATD